MITEYFQLKPLFVLQLQEQLLHFFIKSFGLTKHLFSHFIVIKPNRISHIIAQFLN